MKRRFFASLSIASLFGLGTATVDAGRRRVRRCAPACCSPVVSQIDHSGTSQTPEVDLAGQHAVRQLQVEQIEVLKAYVKQKRMMMLEGLHSLEEFHRAETMLLDVQIEISDSQGQTITLLQEAVEASRQLEKDIERRVAVGTESPESALLVKARRLEREIRLRKAQLMPAG